MTRTGCAIIGSGNIGTDLLIKIKRLSSVLEPTMMVGIDPASDGLARADRMGVATTAKGVDGLIESDAFQKTEIIFDATSAGAHVKHAALVASCGKQMIDLTPAAIGPYVVPCINLESNLEADNVNMVTCGGQATIPIVAAVNRAAPVAYAEIVASIASKSAGPGTRANIDEFTETTSRAIESVGGAKVGKAIIILNPAEPPLVMRDTVYCFVEDGDEEAIAASVDEIVAAVQAYVPGYRLKQAVQFDRISHNAGMRIPGVEGPAAGLKVSIFLEVEGAAHYLPKYAGNLDIMTSAALQTAERLAARRMGEAA